MEIVIQADPEAASQAAARFVIRIIRNKPDAVLGLATGSTPTLLYNHLIRMHQNNEIDFGSVTTFNLDEYVGLPEDHPGSYHYFMRKHLFDHINVKPKNIHIPNGMAGNIKAECARYERKIKEAGGIDLQIVGIGADGHIGFNEPSSSLGSRTRIKTLTEETRRDNARFFGSVEEVPIHCLTMGIGTIMESRDIIFLAFGKKKTSVVAQATEGPITSMVPASVLQLHPNVKVFLDEEAAGGLKRKDYYKWVWDHKPQWQQF